MPIGNSASSFTTNRNQRSSSFGSVSTSSNSSKGQLEDSNFKQTNVQDRMDSTSSVCGSPLIRTKFTGADSSIEYSTRPRDTEDQHPDTVNWEERPSTPTILGYEVMEERAKFTVSIDFCCTPVTSQRLVTCVPKFVLIKSSLYFKFITIKFCDFYPVSSAMLLQTLILPLDIPL